MPSKREICVSKSFWNKGPKRLLLNSTPRTARLVLTYACWLFGEIVKEKRFSVRGKKLPLTFICADLFGRGWKPTVFSVNLIFFYYLRFLDLPYFCTAHVEKNEDFPSKLPRSELGRLYPCLCASPSGEKAWLTTEPCQVKGKFALANRFGIRVQNAFYLTARHEQLD